MYRNDQQILTLLQKDFPLVSHPFKKLAAKLNISEEELLSKMKKFLSEQKITRIGAVFNSRKLGYKSTLVAAKVPEKNLEEVVAIINQIKGVTHNYLRRDEYNLWFTLTSASDHSLDMSLARLKKKARIRDFLNLKAKKIFKIDTSFTLTSEKLRAKKRTEKSSDLLQLTKTDKNLIKELCCSFPLLSAPFKKIGDDLGLKEEEVKEKIKSWVKQGIIRRFGAVVKPTQIGLKGAALGVWKADEKNIEKVGRMMAGFPRVSHCYQRITYPGWSYNLYTMIHGKDKEDCREAAQKISQKTKICDYKLLFTVKELKKKSMCYFED